MTVAPRADAIYQTFELMGEGEKRGLEKQTCIAKQLTPPVPMVSTVLPCRRLSVHAPFQASRAPSIFMSRLPRMALQAVVPAVLCPH